MAPCGHHHEIRSAPVRSLLCRCALDCNNFCVGTKATKLGAEVLPSSCVCMRPMGADPFAVATVCTCRCFRSWGERGIVARAMCTNAKHRQASPVSLIADCRLRCPLLGDVELWVVPCCFALVRQEDGDPDSMHEDVPPYRHLAGIAR